MKTKPFPDFNSPAGIRAVADHLDSLASDPANWEPATPDHQIGHIRIRSTYRALTGAAALLRENAGRRARCSCTAMETDVLKMDAVRHCGSPEAALATIRRQLATQGESMEPADVKRCERAARLIENYLEKCARTATLEAENNVLLARIEAGKEPDWATLGAAGLEAVVTDKDHREYLGKVSVCKIGAHPILGAKHRVALYTVTVSHIRETRDKRYAFHPVKPKTLKRLTPKQVRILPAA